MDYLTPEKTMQKEYLKKVYKGFGSVFKNKFASIIKKNTNNTMFDNNRPNNFNFERETRKQLSR